MHVSVSLHAGFMESRGLWIADAFSRCSVVETVLHASGNSPHRCKETQETSLGPRYCSGRRFEASMGPIPDLQVNPTHSVVTAFADCSMRRAAVRAGYAPR